MAKVEPPYQSDQLGLSLPQPRPGRPAGKTWYPTSQATELLGVSRWTLKRMIDNGTLKRGTHWKPKNPDAAKWTYLFNVRQIEKLQATQN
ncbi:MAG: helix-turn-helix domain-containing protein [Cyanobacteria bacterium P01_A01_bin.123]